MEMAMAKTMEGCVYVNDVLKRAQWLVRSARYPDVVVPVKDERHAVETIEKFRAVERRHQARVPWEYGTHTPGEHGSYRRVGPR